MDEICIEDFFWEREFDQNFGKKLVLVIYDIISDKRRGKFVKLMENYGIRVQKSAFEMVLTDTQYQKLIDGIPEYIAEEDNIRVYKLKINSEIICWGSEITKPKETIII